MSTNHYQHGRRDADRGKYRPPMQRVADGVSRMFFGESSSERKSRGAYNDGYKQRRKERGH